MTRAADAPPVVMPLEHAALCLDCERVFALGGETCPSCGGRQWVLLAKFFTGRDRALVRHTDVLHHAGNGLQPAKARAQLIGRQLAEWIRTGVVRPAFVHEVVIAHVERIAQSVDETMERLRALGPPPLSTEESGHAQDR